MTSSWHDLADTLVSDLQRIFAARLRSVVAYGPRADGIDEAPLTCLALVDNLGLSDLEGCARSAAHWERRHVATPLVLGVDEFRRSLDAFPLEYGEIIRAHALVYGTDPFDGLAIASDDLRRACETQVKSHLLHLRETFIESGNKPLRVADLVVASAPAFAALLRHVARLTGSAATSRGDSTADGARAAGIADSVARDLVSLERGAAMPSADASRLFPAYLEAVEQLAHFVDRWRA